MIKNTISIPYNHTYDQPTVVCLGFFDCLHLGHLQLISRAELIANIRKAKLCVFTFDNNPFAYLTKSSKQVLNFEERQYRLNQLGVDVIFTAEFNEQFAKLTPQEFLEKLIYNKNITDIVVGNDYAFGANATGNIDYLKKFCESQGIAVHVENLKKDGLGIKYSSRSVRELVKNGEVEKIAFDLAYPYFIIGEVVRGRGEGKKLGFPTANIIIDGTKERLQEGVYLTNVIIDGVSLKAVTNVGTHPTFDEYTYNAESYILYFNQDIYGKKIIIEFVKKIRNTTKFASVKELQEQINKDVNLVMSGKI